MQWCNSLSNVCNDYRLAFKHKNPFMHAARTALVIGVGDLMATGTDIYWLIGDMSIQTHPHHYTTGVGLILALVVMVASFLWLHYSIVAYAQKHKKKQQLMYDRIQARVLTHTPTHCNVKVNIPKYHIPFFED